MSNKVVLADMCCGDGKHCTSYCMGTICGGTCVTDIVNPVCTPNCNNAANYCSGSIFSNSCGTGTCQGTKNCTPTSPPCTDVGCGNDCYQGGVCYDSCGGAHSCIKPREATSTPRPQPVAPSCNTTGVCSNNSNCCSGQCLGGLCVQVPVGTLPSPTVTPGVGITTVSLTPTSEWSGSQLNDGVACGGVNESCSFCKNGSYGVLGNRICGPVPTLAPGPGCYCSHPCLVGIGGCSNKLGAFQCEVDCCQTGTCPTYNKSCGLVSNGTTMCIDQSVTSVCNNGKWVNASCVSGTTCKTNYCSSGGTVPPPVDEFCLEVGKTQCVNSKLQQCKQYGPTTPVWENIQYCMGGCGANGECFNKRCREGEIAPRAEISGGCSYRCVDGLFGENYDDCYRSEEGRVETFCEAGYIYKRWMGNENDPIALRGYHKVAVEACQSGKCGNAYSCFSENSECSGDEKALTNDGKCLMTCVGGKMQVSGLCNSFSSSYYFDSSWTADQKKIFLGMLEKSGLSASVFLKTDSRDGKIKLSIGQSPNVGLRNIIERDGRYFVGGVVFAQGEMSGVTGNLVTDLAEVYLGSAVADSQRVDAYLSKLVPIHELGHSIQINNDYLMSAKYYNLVGWKEDPKNPGSFVRDTTKEPPVNEYAAGYPWEDFATSFETAVNKPCDFKKSNPVRYNFMKNEVLCKDSANCDWGCNEVGMESGGSNWLSKIWQKVNNLKIFSGVKAVSSNDFTLIVPGITTETEVMNNVNLNNPDQLLNEGGWKYFVYGVLGLLQNEIITKNGIVEFVKVASDEVSKLSYVNMLTEMGVPEVVLYGIYGPNGKISPVYGYPSKGRAFVAKSVEGEIIEQQRFVTMDVSRYKESWGKNYTEEPETDELGLILQKRLTWLSSLGLTIGTTSISIPDGVGVETVSDLDEIINDKDFRLVKLIDNVSKLVVYDGQATQLEKSIEVNKIYDLTMAVKEEMVSRAGAGCVERCSKLVMGDADCNGVVDAADFNIWRSEYYDQQASTLAKDSWKSNFSCSSTKKTVSMQDYGIWRTTCTETGGACVL